MYQTPPSSGGSIVVIPKINVARRISVATGDNGWKVSGRSSGAPSQHQPNGYEHPGSSFNDRRMRRQSMGSAVGEHPITPAYTPRDSQYGYFSPTHATMSPQEHVAPAMPQPISKRESFVGGFVIPPAYPPYRPAQAPQETPYQYPQTPHHHSAPQYPQTPHHQPVSQPLYPQTPHQQSAPQAPYPQTQHHQPAPQHRTSYYAHNDSYYHGNYAVTTAAAGDVPPSSATAEYFPAAAAAAAASSDNPPAGRARSVKSVRSVRSNKSLNGTSGETKQVPPKKRQITVRSVSEHLVWIDIAPNETGAGIAEKIQTIATYKTKKVLSITTASGRSIPLSRRPLFDDWANVHEIQHGEEWIVEWGDLDRGMMDRIFSKVVQVGEGRPSNANEGQQ